MSRWLPSLVALGCAAALAQPIDGGAAPTCAVDVQVTGLRAGGLVWVLLFSDAQAEAYPTKQEAALKRVDGRPQSGAVKVAFEGLECRAYAVAVVHDENSNGKLDTNFLGIPREGLGASRNARGTFGPPSFEAAKVVVRSGRTALPIAIAY